MAENLFSGGAVDGDNALCEAALSARCFYRLCEAGVPFPCNRYGEYVGYKTEHDPFARATSAGPLISKFMTEVLEKKAEELQVEVYDHLLAVEVLTDEEGVCGLICLDRKDNCFVAFSCGNVILATGGPAGIYADSVYPTSHRGSTGLALNAGASLQNMTEWQYGLASVFPRWNVSGTYMQVLPRFVSVDEKGVEREFLSEFFADAYEALSKVFLKGYQWPFDAKKAGDGSSVIDLLVYRATVLRNRRVYLDFTRNPFGLKELEYERLSAEAFSCLSSAEACFGTPIMRLQKMNTPAIELYASKGVNIEEEYLEKGNYREAKSFLLSAMIDYAENVNVSRGSALYYDKLGELQTGLEEMFRFSAKNSSETGKVIQEVSLQKGEAVIRWRPVRPIPEDNDFFETVWRRYREDGKIY